MAEVLVKAVAGWEARRTARLAFPDLVKVGPEGYIHGWICVRPPCGKKGSKITHHELGAGTVSAVSESGKPVAAKFGEKTVKLGNSARRGDELWSSQDGVAQDATPREVESAQKAWFGHKGFFKTTGYLLGKNEADDELKSQVEDIKSLISKAKPFSRPAELYRGVDHDVAMKVFGDVGSSVGDVIESPSFQATTTRILEKVPKKRDLLRGAYRFGAGGKLNGDWTNTIMHFHVPKGTKALKGESRFFGDKFVDDPDYVAENHHEYLFAPGTRYRVVSDNVTDDKSVAKALGPWTDHAYIRHIHVEVMPS